MLSGLRIHSNRRHAFALDKVNNIIIVILLRLAANASADRMRLETKRDRIEGERQRNIDLVIKYVISEEDAKQRIAELKEEQFARRGRTGSR